MQTGAMEVICGPMFSGKTEELIRRLRRAQIARLRVLVFKPSIDDRYSQADVVSHSSLRILSVPVTSTKDMCSYLEQIDFAVDVVGIDEVQFFDSGVVDLAEILATRGIRVILAGLDQDYLGRPFGPMPELLARADSAIKQSAVCVVCGNHATKSQRIAHANVSDAQVLIGATEGYEARCRRCHIPRIDSPKAHVKEPLVHEAKSF